MSKIIKLFASKALILLCTLVLGNMNSFAQKEILLYASDFTKWGAMAGTGSGDLLTATGDGDGFQLFAKPQVKPTTSTPDGLTGIICSDNSTNYIEFRPFTFISGGALEVEFYNSKNGKTITLSGATVLSSTIDAQPASPLPISTTSGAVFTTGKNFGHHKITYIFSGVGSQTLRLTTNAKCGEIDINSFKVYSGVGAIPYIAATNYSAAPAAGLSISGTIGGSVVSGTVNVKAWNIAGPITMSIIGEDAAKFSLPLNTLTNAQAIAGQNVTVNFTPSVRAGISNAQLKLSSVGAPDYIINLNGITSTSAAPQITTSSSSLQFATSLIASASNTVNISGVNLTGNVTISFTGPNAAQFSVINSVILKSDVLAGKDIVVKYQGDIQLADHTANMVLSSPGAPNITIPLVGKTLNTKPEMFGLKFIVSPAGTAYIDTDPAGISFLKGTVVKVKATPETGWKLDRWNDGLGGSGLTRNITMSAEKGTITVYFVPGVQGTDPGPITVGTFTAFVPTVITETTMSVNWTAVSGATNYTLTVYDENDVVVGTPIVTTNTNATISGLTGDKLYKYKVQADSTPVENTSTIGLFRTLPPLVNPYHCGE